ncbi:MaoC family dehydratase [Nocardioides marmoribigeumensis]|uniref:Acyl dehydratase n=1 Tax=Nocardioides marmoribigeumensis TaxID=433649 RepID=A0ABU2BZX4_9ACTN|nr:MaoC family dehydratase [Nocardioides marmoribigeumensis]MDR7363956.1 acyl dehydratase [Nocardioides marmoribigeumensis]
MRVFKDLDEVAASVGETIGPTGWIPISQRRVNAFADATDDHQWIHVDRERAAESQFGGTIAHGYLTLSLLPMIASKLFVIEHRGAKLNYGVNKVRFPAPVLVDSKIRGSVTVSSVEDLSIGKRLVLDYVVEAEGQDKPAMVAQSVVVVLDEERPDA